MIYTIVFWLLFNLRFDYIHAPELISGQSINAKLHNIHVYYVDGGNWQAVQIGKQSDGFENGLFFRLSGENIDNDNLPVPYRVELHKNNKARGFIVYRGHERKLCTAPFKKSLPCR